MTSNCTELMDRWVVQLDYPLDAFQPHISARTMDRHYNAHYMTYATNLVGCTTPELSSKSLENIVRSTSGIPGLTKIYNNAGQLFNHNHFWSCLCPAGQSQPSLGIRTLVEQQFGSLEGLVDRIVEIGCGQFGSGWVWLTGDRHTSMQVLATSNADSPRDKGAILACVDVWEHAYYLDYQQDRKTYIHAVATQLWDWSWIERRYNLSVES